MSVTTNGKVADHVPAHTAQRCESVAPVLARIGDKWSMLIVILLGPGPRRFNDLKRAVDGISQRMLSLTLRRLERDGLVARAVTPTIPPRVDYSLTELGQSLRAAVETLGAWAHANHAAIAAAQKRYEQRRREQGGHEQGGEEQAGQEQSGQEQSGQEHGRHEQGHNDEGLAGNASAV